jgi:tetratricopeptide (TPR) repeat protein
MKTYKGSLFAKFASLAGIAVFLSAPAFAQGTGATVHGHVNNPAGQSLTNANVKFTKDKTVAYKDAKILKDAPLDENGNYTAEGLAPGDYFVYVVSGTVVADQLPLTVGANDTNLTLNDDMTRDEYIKSMSPEARQALEDYKKKNASAVSANQVIAKLNETLKTVRADLAAALPNKDDVSKDVASMKDAVTAKADVGLLWLTYGDVLQAEGNHLKSEDQKAGKSSTDDAEAMKAYADAVEAYQKGIALDSAGTKPNIAIVATDYNQLGNALIATGKTEDAVAAFDNAAKTDPTKAGMYYKNEAAVLFNSNKMDEALAAADKAIAADPAQADPYFIKGQALVTKSSVDPATQKLTPPAGCVEAYQKFLQLAPNDPKVSQVNAVLSSLGQTIDTKYKSAPKKKGG